MQKLEMLHLLAKEVSGCTRCPSLAETRTQTVFGEGNPNARIILLGEAPGYNEDSTGLPFVGKAGELLTNIIKACGWKREDLYVCNILRCRPPNNRTPEEAECKNCRPYLDLQIKIINPKYIVCLGAVAAQNLLGRSEGINALRGEWFMYKHHKVLCTFHPAYVLRNQSAKRLVWQDLQMLLEDIKNDQE